MEEPSMVIVHASASIRPEARERWLEVLDATATASRAEEACRSYVVYEAVQRPNAFIFVEEWASLDGLYAHFRAPHFGELSAALGELSAEPPAGTVCEVSAKMALDEALAAAGAHG
jgi:quinol monooxygenase YgiN